MATGNAGADVLLAWTQAGVIAQALGSIGIILTLCYSAWTFATTLRERNYAELDRAYFDLLKIALERPYLLTSQPPADPLKAREYDAYAAMVWNFLETIVDRCEGTADRHLRDTWYPIVATENAMHRTWFDMPENRRKFKERFRRYIEKNYPVSAAPSVATDAARR
ncbi:MAG TPA: hypothetical protein VK841_06610 [Polyangiaceae bacterium]|nr:hypothetical protein [Polyangiaceae bacterium]